MKRVIRGTMLSLLIVGAFASLAVGQVRVGEVLDAGETGWATYDIKTKQWQASTPEGGRYGNLVFDNHASAHTYWNMGYENLHYIALDWGKMQPSATGLSSEIIDGFEFRFSTNDHGTAGIMMDIHFYDGCTGWGNLGFVQAVFPFTGLPNAAHLPPGVNKNWVITSDLEGTGYEFLLGSEIGWAHVYHNGMGIGGDPATGPVIGKKPFAGGNGDTGTDNAFDIYYPNGNWSNTYWFGGSPWATWPLRLWGGEEYNTTYYGQGSQGNFSELYVAGGWYGSNTLTFLMRNPSHLQSYILPSLKQNNVYVPSHDITRLVGLILGGPVMRPMSPDPVGQFDRGYVTLPATVPQIAVYFQGAAFTIGSVPPIDMSNGIKYN